MTLFYNYNGHAETKKEKSHLTGKPQILLINFWT
jgi:hypothetical protein